MKIDKTVRVELSAADIEEAIRNHIAKQVPGISECKLDIFDTYNPTNVGQPRNPVNDRLEAFAEIALVDAPAPVKRDLLKREPIPFAPLVDHLSGE